MHHVLKASSFEFGYKPGKVSKEPQFKYLNIPVRKVPHLVALPQPQQAYPMFLLFPSTTTIILNRWDVISTFFSCGRVSREIILKATVRLKSWFSDLTPSTENIWKVQQSFTVYFGAKTSVYPVITLWQLSRKCTCLQMCNVRESHSVKSFQSLELVCEKFWKFFFFAYSWIFVTSCTWSERWGP